MTVQERILCRLVGVTRRVNKNPHVGFYTRFADLNLGEMDPCEICISVAVSLNIPDFPETFWTEIPTIGDLQDEMPPLTPGARRPALTLRQMSVSMTLWLYRKHPDQHSRLAQAS